MTDNKVKTMIIVAQLAVLIALLAQVTVPIGVIPLTGQTFAVALIAVLFRPGISVKVILFYLLLGALNLPVFAGGKAGLATLVGPTGGFLVGFILQATVISTLVQKGSQKILPVNLATLFGAALNLVIGLVWLTLTSGLSVSVSFQAAVGPFILPELIKALLAANCGLLLRRRLKKIMII